MQIKYFRAFTVLFGLSLTGGLFWSIISVIITHDNEQIVAGVGLIGISAIGVSSFLTYLLLVANHTGSSVAPIERSKNIPDEVFIMIYEGDIINIGTSADTPLTFVVFENLKDVNIFMDTDTVILV